MSTLLSAKEVESHLKHIGLEWSVIGGSHLERSYKFDDFKHALTFVIKLGHVAERLNHHPEVQLSWGKVVVQIKTHSEGGITAKDFALAKEIDAA